MKRLLKKICIVGLLMVFFLDAKSQNIIDINEALISKSQTPEIPITKLKSEQFDGALRARFYQFNPRLRNLTSMNIGDILMLNFFEDKQYKATIEKISTDKDGVISVTAKISNSDYGYCYMSISQNGISMTTEIPELDEDYFIGASNGTFYVSLYKRSDLLHKEPRCAFDELPENNISSSDLKTFTISNCSNSDLEANVTIDLLVVYTPEARSWAANSNLTTDINSLISTMMNISNQVMNNSKTGVTFRLVHKQEVNYNETDSYSTDLSRLRAKNDGYMDEVHTLRKQYNADLVVLLSMIKGAGGVAYKPSSVNGNSESNVFSITHPQYTVSGYTAVHEIGHNMGCSHHKDQGSKGLFPYSTGWRGVNNKGKKICTVLPYYGSGESRIPYFSNPNLVVDGVTIGTPNYEDNVQTIKRMKCVTSKYSETLGEVNTNDPPSVTITSPSNNATVASNTVSVTTNVVDNHHSISKVEFFLNGVLKTTKTTTPFTASLDNLAEGANTIMVKAHNSKGLSSSKSINVTYEIPGGGNSTNCDGVPVWSSSKAYNGGDKVSYNGYIYTAAYWTQNNRPDQNFGAYGKPWKDNRIECSTGANASPVISITSPSDGANISTSSINVTANASISEGLITKVDFYLNGEFKQTDTSAPYSVPSLGILRTGINTITAKAVSDKNMITESTISVNHSSPTQNTPPTISITSPSNGTIVNTTSVNVSAFANATDATVTKVEFYLNGVLKSTKTTSPYSASIGTLNSGANNLKAIVYDSKGLTAESSVNISYSSPIQNTPPTITITSPSNGVTVNTTSVNISVFANATDATVTKVEFYLNGVLKSTKTTSPFTATIGVLNSGSNVIEAKVYDSKGQNAESSINLSYVNSGGGTGDDCMGVVTWSSAKAYVAGEKARDGNVIYKANYWTKDNKPNDNHGSGKPWSVVSNCDGTSDLDSFGETTMCEGVKILVWKSNNVYDKPGTRVVYNGKIYESKYWTQSNVPANGGAWALIGDCK